MKDHLWGVSTGEYELERIELVLKVAAADSYIVDRLQREKRCGTVTQMSTDLWKFTASVYDAQELLPWLRTFIGRIVSLTCSNRKVETQFWADMALLSEMYGGE
jgi:hypothetical protein